VFLFGIECACFVVLVPAPRQMMVSRSFGSNLASSPPAQIYYRAYGMRRASHFAAKVQAKDSTSDTFNVSHLGPPHRSLSVCFHKVFTLKVFAFAAGEQYFFLPLL